VVLRTRLEIGLHIASIGRNSAAPKGCRCGLGALALVESRWSDPTPRLLVPNHRSLEIPTFHLQRIDVQIPHEYVPRLGQWFLSIARVPTTRRAMSELVSSS